MSRLLRDESGMAMGLAVIVVVIIGVMGAGLLVFVRNDLEAVVEVNQGQRAFEMADAGVQAAKQKLSSLEPGENIGDTQWSSSSDNNMQDCANLGSDGSASGVCLTDLYDPTVEDAVNVQIGQAGNTFTVVSTGEYGNAKRRIEAVFRSSSGTEVNGVPAYYTPGSIELKKEGQVSVSVFAGKNIEFGKNTLVSSETEDRLGDWDNSPYNTVGREKNGVSYTKTGLAAEGYICGNGSCKDAGDSIADGVIGYDRTTSAKGNKLKFVEKNPPDKIPNDEGTITYPFSPVPNVEGLLEEANSGSPNVYEEISSSKYDLSGSTSKRVVFIDAEGGTVNLSKDTVYRGILVVRCGDLDFAKDVEFEGIIMLLKGEGGSCSGKGKFRVDKDYQMNGYIYAESAAEDAMYIKKDATLNPLPEGEYEDYLELAYRQPLKLEAWRELYE